MTANFYHKLRLQLIFTTLISAFIGFYCGFGLANYNNSQSIKRLEVLYNKVLYSIYKQNADLELTLQQSSRLVSELYEEKCKDGFWVYKGISSLYSPDFDSLLITSQELKK